MVGMSAMAQNRWVDGANGDDVNNDGSQALPFATIQKGIDSLVTGGYTAGSTVYVAPGTYAPIAVPNLPIRIEGSGYPVTFIDGGGTARCATLSFGWGDEFDTVLEGFTLQNGYADCGGGVIGGTLTSCVITSCEAEYYGGGALLSKLANCFVNGNTAESGGGAWECDLTVCVVEHNTALLEGGGVWDCTATSLMINYNVAGNEGGGAWQSNLDDAWLEGNSARMGGGALGGQLSHCTIVGNTASVNGGGMTYGDIEWGIISNNVVTAASMGYTDLLWDQVDENGVGIPDEEDGIGGGGLYSVSAYGCVVTMNRSTVGGGAKACTLANSVLSHNESDNGGGAKDSVLDHCSVLHNLADWGGGLHTCTFVDSWVATNTARFVGGGAVNAVIWDSSVEGNVATNTAGNGLGGGTYWCTAFASSIGDNLADLGGGIAMGTALDGTTLWGNTATLGGGAYEGTLNDSVVVQNFASADGGGMYNSWAARSLLDVNTSGGSGGGMYGGGALDSVLYSNTARSGSGGGACSAIINNCTVMYNVLDERLGGVYTDIDSAAVADSICVNSIIWDNYYVDAQEEYSWANGGLSSGNGFTHCCLQVLPVNDWGNNITDDPKLVFDALRGLPSLGEGSPAINAGSNEYVEPDRTTDFYGNARIAYGVVDIGAHEFSGVNHVTVTLDANGGSVSSNSFVVVTGGQYEGLPEATRYGYTSDGWMLGDLLVTSASNVTLFVAHELVVAGWTPKTVQVTYDSDGDGVADETVGLPYGSSYNDLSPLPAKSGYKLVGWKNSSGQTVTHITDENAHTVTPVFVADTVTVYVDLDGDGVVGVGEPTVDLTIGSLYTDGITPTPSKPGYDFTGWLDEDGMPLTTVDTTTPHTVKPGWEPKNVSVTFNGGAGSSLATPLTKTLKYDAAYDPGVTVTRYGYTLDGWTLTSGSRTIALKITTVSTHNVWAVWTAKTVQIPVDTDGDGNSDATVPLAFGDSYSDITPPTKEGYDFGGWADSTGPVDTVDSETPGMIHPIWIPRIPTEVTDVPIITAISVNLDDTVNITVSNCVQTAGIFYLVGTADLTAPFLPLVAPAEVLVSDTVKINPVGGIWQINNLAPAAGSEKFFYRAAVRLPTAP